MRYNQLNTKQFIERSKTIHGDQYSYDKVVYTNAYTKVTIECQVHGNFNQIPANHLIGRGCRLCGLIVSGSKRRNDSETFVYKSREIHGDTYDYSKVKYRVGKEKVTIICRKHGDFLQTPSDHLNGYGCAPCGRLRIGEQSRDTFTDFLKKAKNIHGDTYTYNEKTYISGVERVEIICKTHGVFHQRANAHLKGAGCSKCGDIRVSEAHRHSKDDFIHRSRQVHGNRYSYECTEYKLSGEKVAIICRDHGKFMQSPNNHISKKAGCPACNASKGELALEEIFNKHEVRHQREYRIPTVNLRFEYDFYLADKNLLIEFQGIQHFKPIDYFGGVENFLYVKRNDLLKKQIAKSCNYNLIYFDYRQLKQLTKDEFEKLVLSRVVKFTNTEI